MRAEEVIEVIKSEGFNPEEFFKWMTGQTVGMYDDRSIDYYSNDVELWLEQKRKGIIPKVYD